MEENMDSSLILATDRSRAYYLINHKILLKKLEHHGVGQDSLNLIGSFLEDRTFFVELKGFKSEKKRLNNFSAVQGSKSGGFTIQSIA